MIIYEDEPQWCLGTLSFLRNLGAREADPDLIESNRVFLDHSARPCVLFLYCLLNIPPITLDRSMRQQQRLVGSSPALQPFLRGRRGYTSCFLPG